MPFMTTDDGVRLFVREEGVPDGPPVLFAHEFGGDHRSWDAQVAAFAGRCRILRYNARGFLPSEVPGPKGAYGQDRSTRDLAQVADHFGLDRFHLVGCSMGSFTSLRLAAEQPHRIASLTLTGVSSGPDDDGRADYHAMLEPEIALLESDLGEGAVGWFAADPAYRRLEEKVPAAWAAYRERLLHQSVHGALMTVTTLHWDRIALASIADRIAAITAPVLLIHGTEDGPRVDPANRWLAGVLPNARHVPVERTGHLVQIEEAALFNAELAALIGL